MIKSGPSKKLLYFKKKKISQHSPFVVLIRISPETTEIKQHLLQKQSSSRTLQIQLFLFLKLAEAKKAETTKTFSPQKSAVTQKNIWETRKVFRQKWIRTKKSEKFVTPQFGRFKANKSSFLFLFQRLSVRIPSTISSTCCTATATTTTTTVTFITPSTGSSEPVTGQYLVEKFLVITDTIMTTTCSVAERLFRDQPESLFRLGEATTSTATRTSTGWANDGGEADRVPLEAGTGSTRRTLSKTAESTAGAGRGSEPRVTEIWRWPSTKTPKRRTGWVEGHTGCLDSASEVLTTSTLPTRLGLVGQTSGISGTRFLSEAAATTTSGLLAGVCRSRGSRSAKLVPAFMIGRLKDLAQVKTFTATIPGLPPQTRRSWCLATDTKVHFDTEPEKKFWIVLKMLPFFCPNLYKNSGLGVDLVLQPRVPMNTTKVLMACVLLVLSCFSVSTGTSD